MGASSRRRPPAGRPHGDPAYGPDECPFGHRLGPGRVLVGWAPCQCPPAFQAYGGHRTHTCRACGELNHRTTVAYSPPHIIPPTARPPGAARRGRDAGTPGLP